MFSNIELPLGYNIMILEYVLERMEGNRKKHVKKEQNSTNQSPFFLGGGNSSMFSLKPQSERAKPIFALFLDFEDIYYSSHRVFLCGTGFCCHDGNFYCCDESFCCCGGKHMKKSEE